MEESNILNKNMKKLICLDTWTRNIQLLCQKITLSQISTEIQGRVLHGHKMEGVGEVCVLILKNMQHYLESLLGEVSLLK